MTKKLFPFLPVLTRPCLVIGSLLLASNAFADSGQWPQFRGPTGQGLSEAIQVPSAFSPTKNLTWKTAIPGAGWSSPVIVDGALFLTSAVTSGKQTSLHALKIDAANGKLLWDREVFKPSPDQLNSKHKKNGDASATPIVNAGKVYVHFGHMGTAALDAASGDSLWTKVIDYSPIHGNGGSPALVGDLLVFSVDGNEKPFVIALDAANGDIRWKTPRESNAKKKFSFSTPLAIDTAEGTQIISAGSGMVGSYAPEDGRLIWSVDYGEGYSVVPRPLFAKGHLFLSTGYDKANLLAIRVDSKSIGDVTKSHLAWTLSRSVPNTPSMLIVGDAIYFVSDGGILTCADTARGETHWSKRLGGDYSASPIAVGDHLYFFSETGKATIVKASVDNLQIISESEMGERVFASPAALDGALFVRSESHLWRFGNAN